MVLAALESPTTDDPNVVSRSRTTAATLCFLSTLSGFSSMPLDTDSLCTTKYRDGRMGLRANKSLGAACEQQISEQMVLRARDRASMRMRFILMSLCLAVAVPVHAASSLDLANSRGRVVYLDFWASWCGPCKQSFPWMETLKSSYESQGLEIVTVNLDTDRASADKFLKQFHPTFDVHFDPNGELAELYKVHGMPSSVLIDRHGMTRFTHVGFRPIDGPVYEAQVRELLAEH